MFDLMMVKFPIPSLDLTLGLLRLGLGLGLVNIKITKNVLFKVSKLSIKQGSNNINQLSVKIVSNAALS